MTDVFLSFNHSDKDIATPFLKKLQEAGYSVHQSSQGIPHDKAWRKSIRSAISDSDALILILPRREIEDSWLTYEIGLAEALGKKIVLLLSEQSADLPDELDQQNYNVLPFNSETVRSSAIEKINVA